MDSMYSGTVSLLALVMLASASHLMSWFGRFGLFGLFLVSIVDSSFVPLPLPGVTDIMLVVYSAAHANIPLLVAIATLGSALGGLFSHAVGQAGGMAFLERTVPHKVLGRATSWMERHSILAIALPAILPPPVPLSPFVLAAGALHMSRRKFMTAFTLSRLTRHLIAAWLGIRYGRNVLSLWSRFSDRWATTVLLVFWVVILLFTALAIWKLVRISRELKLQPGSRNRASRAVPAPGGSAR